MRTARGNWVAFLIGLGFAVLTAEAILQVHYRYRHGLWLFQERDNFIVDYIIGASDPREYTLQPGYSAKNLSINSDGYRGWPVCPTDPTPLICVLGDSVPFGIGVKDRETYPFLLQAELRKAGVRANVLNAGVPSYNLAQAFARYHYEVSPRYLPALVIVQSANDVMLVTHYREKWRPGVTWATIRMKGGLNRSGAAAKLALVNYGRQALGKTAPEEEFHREYAPDRMVTGIRGVLRKHLAYFVERKIPVILLPNDPFYYSAAGDARNRGLKRWSEFAFYHRVWAPLVDAYNRVLADAAEPARGVYFFDSRSLMDARERERLYGDFIHLSPAGNVLLAKALAEFIHREKLIPGSKE